MKTTAREKKLWLIVLIATCGIIIYRVAGTHFESIPVGGEEKISLAEGRQLLSNGANILARHQAAHVYLEELRSQFLEGAQPVQAEIVLLERVENIAAKCGLKVEQKSMLSLGEDLIGISLEGTTRPEPLFYLLHQAATINGALNVQRLQVLSNSEKMELKYQVILVAKILKGAGKKP